MFLEEHTQAIAMDSQYKSWPQRKLLKLIKIGCSVHNGLDAEIKLSGFASFNKFVFLLHSRYDGGNMIIAQYQSLPTNILQFHEEDS